MITLLIAQNGQNIKGQQVRCRNITSTNTCLNTQLLMSFPDGALSKVVLANIHQTQKNSGMTDSVCQYGILPLWTRKGTRNIVER
jgi:hypothetical protein